MTDLVHQKISKMVTKKLHLESRTYDYGHNDMQTDIFCKFCGANQAKYLSTYYHGQLHEIMINGEWHKRGCVAIIILREEK